MARRCTYKEQFDFYKDLLPNIHIGYGFSSSALLTNDSAVFVCLKLKSVRCLWKSEGDENYVCISMQCLMFL